MTKPGPKGNHYVHNRETILNLRRDKKSGRFYPVGKGSPSFGSDPEKAIHRFRLWQREQDGSPPPPPIPVTMPNSLEALDATIGRDRTMIPTTWSPDGIETDLESIRQQERDRIRNLIYSDPKRASVDLDCEPLALLANVEDLKPPAASKPLFDLLESYLDVRTLTPTEAENSRTWWKEFRAITGAKVITDLSRDAFKKYRKTIKARKEKRSSVWVRSRFGKIKTIINDAAVELDLSDTEKSILSHKTLLKQPPKPKPKPLDISAKNMKAILSKADKWEKAVILLSLNAAYYPVDCKRLTWDMVNFEKELIRFDRSKSEKLTDTPLPRICALWKRTIRALKAIKNGHSHVFLSTQKQPAATCTFNDHFVALCDKAGVKDRTFKHLRKSAMTAASNDPTVPDRQIDLLAGQSAGIKEHYVVRRNVELACEAIERYYFRGKK